MASPQNLVGRKDLLEEIMVCLREGPWNTGYFTTLLAPRGAGKTVMLDEVRDRAATEGWFVVSLGGTSADFEGLLLEEILNALHKYECANQVLSRNIETVTSHHRGYTTGLRFFSRKSERSTSRTSYPRQLTLRSVLRWFGEHAASQENNILLVLDQLHRRNKAELCSLLELIQELTRWEGLPIAFLGAALPQFRYTAVDDPKITFFNDNNSILIRLPDLTFSQARRGLRSTVIDAGGTIESEALDIAAKAVGALPYKLQVVGYHMWNIAGARGTTIDVACAKQAVEQAQTDIREDIYDPSWNDFSPVHRGLVSLLSDNKEGVSPRRIPSLMPDLTPQQIETGINQLKTLGHVENQEVIRLTRFRTYDKIGRYENILGLMTTESTEQDQVLVLTESFEYEYLASLVATERALTSSDDRQSTDESSYRHNQALSSAPRKCNAWMPRSYAHCILLEGHKGHHRSTRGRPKH